MIGYLLGGYVVLVIGLAWALANIVWLRREMGIYRTVLGRIEQAEMNAEESIMVHGTRLRDHDERIGMVTADSIVHSRLITDINTWRQQHIIGTAEYNGPISTFRMASTIVDATLPNEQGK